jgi:hypothetical protein
VVSFPGRAGEEFDWFAADESGQVAIFATGGGGPVPAQVLTDAAFHDAVGDQIDVSGWGTDAVWSSYARAGLFAYDWDERRNCYSRVAVPAQPVGDGLSALLAAVVLPRLALSFLTDTTVAIDAA